MPAATLETPKAITNTVTSVKVTGVVNDTERGVIDIHFMTLLEDGTPYQRGNVQITGHDEIKDVYAEIDAKLSTGLTFEESSRQVLYNRAIAFVQA